MIQNFADWLVYGVFGLDASSHLGEAVNFFFYDSIKILILLFLISAIMGVVNAYFPIDRLRNFLTPRNLYGVSFFFASPFLSPSLSPSVDCVL